MTGYSMPRTLGRAVRLVWRSAPGWGFLSAILVLFQGSLPLISLYLMKRIIDAVTAATRSGPVPGSFERVLPWIIMAAAAGLLMVLCRSLGELAQDAQSMAVTDEVADELHAQSAALDLAHYEDPKYHDLFHRAQFEAPYRPGRVVSGMTQMAQSALALAGIGGFLISLDWRIGLGLLVLALPASLARVRYARKLHQMDLTKTEQERRAWYYHWLLTDSGHAKEIRLFGLGSLFRDRFREIRTSLRRLRLSLVRARSGADFAGQALATVAIFGTFAILALRALRGSLGLGSLVVYYQGFQSGLGYLQSTLRSGATLYEDSLFLADMHRFLDLKPRVVVPAATRPVPKEIRRGIAFEGVGFAYPSSEQSALFDIDLTLSPGEIVALVGENGSGKTTLIKLLCRLYDPGQGRITVEETDLRDLDPVMWRRELSLLFQDYAHYYLQARENILAGRRDRRSGRRWGPGGGTSFRRRPFPLPPAGRLRHHARRMVQQGPRAEHGRVAEAGPGPRLLSEIPPAHPG